VSNAVAHLHTLGTRAATVMMVDVMPMLMWRCDRVYLAVHNVKVPSDDEWRRWLVMCRERTGRNSVCLVDAGASELTISQRATLIDVVRHQNMRVAVMTDSHIARAILTAFTWLGLDMRAFPDSDVKHAAAYLALTDSELQRVLEQIAWMRAELGMRALPASSD
jgi:hypothetical protein